MFALDVPIKQYLLILLSVQLTLISWLSSGEQQRVALNLARALLMRPDWLFLDESTSAVDEKLEAELYAVLARRLPKTTIMCIGHRSAVVRQHQRHLEMCPEGDHFTLYDTARALAPAE